jgi:hypothetical protein
MKVDLNTDQRHANLDLAPDTKDVDTKTTKVLENEVKGEMELRKRKSEPKKPEMPPADVDTEKFSMYKWTNLLPIALYMMLAYTVMNYQTALPLFLSADISKGGIQLSSQETALKLGMIAIGKLISQSFLFQALLKSLRNADAVYRFSMAVLVPVHLSFPLIRMLESQYQSTMLYSVMAILGICDSMANISVMMVISNGQKPENLGFVHGFSSTMAALVRAIAPATSGTIWEWGVARNWPWFVFFVGASIASLGARLARF